MKPRSLFLDLAKKYKDPKSVQRYLKTLTYNREKEKETIRSAWQTEQTQEAHCLEGCLLAAAILEQQGYEPLLLCLDSIDNLNHAIFIFKTKTGWGSIGKSREPGLHGRAPVFKSIKSLAMSYADPFVDKTGILTGYHTIHLDETGADWRNSKRNVWQVDRYIVGKKYKKLSVNQSKSKKLRELYLKNGSLPSGAHWW